MMKQALEYIKSKNQNLELLWASCREIYSIFEANEIGCDIITVPNSMINKLNLVGKDLEDYYQETVQMFYKDATSSGFTL